MWGDVGRWRLPVVDKRGASPAREPAGEEGGAEAVAESLSRLWGSQVGCGEEQHRAAAGGVVPQRPRRGAGEGVGDGSVEVVSEGEVVGDGADEAGLRRGRCGEM